MKMVESSWEKDHGVTVIDAAERYKINQLQVGTANIAKI